MKIETRIQGSRNQKTQGFMNGSSNEDWDFNGGANWQTGIAIEFYEWFFEWRLRLMRCKDDHLVRMQCFMNGSSNEDWDKFNVVPNTLDNLVLWMVLRMKIETFKKNYLRKIIFLVCFMNGSSNEDWDERSLSNDPVVPNCFMNGSSNEDWDIILHFWRR